MIKKFTFILLGFAGLTAMLYPNSAQAFRLSIEPSIQFKQTLCRPCCPRPKRVVHRIYHPPVRQRYLEPVYVHPDDYVEYYEEVIVPEAEPVRKSVDLGMQFRFR